MGVSLMVLKFRVRDPLRKRFVRIGHRHTVPLISHVSRTANTPFLPLIINTVC